MEKRGKDKFLFEVPGSVVPQPRTPHVLATGGTRAVGVAGVDALLQCVTPIATYDLSPTARSATREVGKLEASSGEVVTLELEGGFTLITSPDRLSKDLHEQLHGGGEGQPLRIDAFRDHSGTTRGVTEWVGRILTVLKLDEDEIYAEARKFAADKLFAKAEDLTTWAGTKALMWAIETRVSSREGLCRWSDTLAEPMEIVPEASSGSGGVAQKAESIANALNHDAAEGPLLVFVHGTASSGPGSFGELRSVAGLADWDKLTEKFGARIFSFEHRTFSQSPIENALLLAKSLPARARISLVTHSRGGLVGDLLCLPGIPGAHVDEFARASETEGASTDMNQADAKDRQDLLELSSVLAAKQFRVERYVRIACPARGSLLLSAHFDAFLSSLLHLIGLVPGFTGSPLYSGLRRIALEIAKNRTDPRLVPGIEAMLPESPLCRLLTLVDKPPLRMAVITGDIQGENLLKRIGVFLTDTLFFEHRENDLVVETDSMFGGIAAPERTRYLFEQSRDVSHFRYLANRSSRGAVRQWLTADEPEGIPAFTLYSAEARKASVTVRAPRAPVPAGSRPVVFVIPGIMGSHLRIGLDRVWFDFLDLAKGGLEKIRAGAANVAPHGLFEMFYGDLCEALEATHEVKRFAYDWRESVFEAGGRLAVEVDVALDATETGGHPVRLLAHSMGGLVARAMLARFPRTWDRLMKRSGARVLMLGTPNRGAHLMVEQLLGKASTIRQLASLDIRHDLQQILDIVAGYRGALQLLPSPALKDASGKAWNFFDPKTWEDFKKNNREKWFSKGATGLPAGALLTEVRANWDKLPESLPNRENILYVAGQATNTPCGVELLDDRLRMIGTPKGDGSVTWESGLLEGIEHWFMPGVSHGELCDTSEHFPAIFDLLTTGTTGRLPRTAPALRAPDQLVRYDAGPVLYPTEEEFTRGLLGARPRSRAQRRALPKLRVSCRAADLRVATDPVLVGHYERDAISGAEDRLDKMLDQALSMRKHLGLYAGPIGTATVVLPTPNPEERARGTGRGAVVIGLGEYDQLTALRLAEAARAGAMRYLLQWVDTHEGVNDGEGAGPQEIGLASLLVGYNSTTNLSIEDSVYAIVRGVAEATRQFTDAMTLRVRIARLEFVECYLDTAITAAKALRNVAARLQGDAERLGLQVEAEPELQRGEGIRQRLDAVGGAPYWPRLIVTDAARKGADCPPECYEAETPPKVPAQPAPETTLDGDKLGPTAIAEKLRFVYLGQRARAETVVRQRQPGLVETLVAKAIRQSTYNEDFARTLFQQLVPHDFKESARQTDRMVLVVDGYTANLPWEMLSAGDKPLAVHTAMVRQLASTRYRPRVRSSLDRIGYVVGNPSTAGYAKMFGKAGETGTKDPDPLPGAEAEARLVAGILEGAGFELVVAPDGSEALDVINKLYQKPYRILHIAAHGTYNAIAKGGQARTGVILSDGLLLTAAEIEAMEIVPDLVFLNCCFLGQIDREPVAYNRLAYSVARELIEMGVRAVVVAGWAVNDAAARKFAEVFYTALLQDGMSFGDAVHRARVAVYDSPEHRGVNTWGAYQAYGDPGFLIDPTVSVGRGGDDRPAVSPEELLDRIESRRADIGWARKGPGKRGPEDIRKRLEADLKRYPATWSTLPEVLMALGRFYRDLGSAHFPKAIDYYRRAISAEDKRGCVPIQAFEQLANLEARWGERSGDATLIETAISRLRSLVEGQAAGAGETVALPNAERCALLGSAYKRLAALQLSAADKRWQNSLREAIAWYGKIPRDAAAPGFDPYPVLNGLQLGAVFGEAEPAAAALAGVCGQVARQRYLQTRDYWDALMPVDAELTRSLLEGTLTRDPEVEVPRLTQLYRDAREAVHETVRGFDSVIDQLRLLARFLEARPERKTEGKRCAQQLRLIADALQPAKGGAPALAEGRPEEKESPSAEVSKAAAEQPEAPDNPLSEDTKPS